MIKRKAVLNRKSARVHDGPLMFINNSIITYPIAFTLYNFDFKSVRVCRMFDDQRKINEKV